MNTITSGIALIGAIIGVAVLNALPLIIAVAVLSWWMS